MEWIAFGSDTGSTLVGFVQASQSWAIEAALVVEQVGPLRALTATQTLGLPVNAVSGGPVVVAEAAQTLPALIQSAAWAQLPPPAPRPVLPDTAGRDVALIWNNEAGGADFAVSGGDLTLDLGLHTAVMISLFSDALADPSDVLPDGTGDRRGWVGDVPIGGSAAYADPIGSRLWLYETQRQTEPVRRGIETAARDALGWMIRDGVADRVEVAATFPYRDRVDLAVTVHQAGQASRYDFNWNNT